MKRKKLISSSPCLSCPSVAEGKVCCKPVNPEAPSHCKKWEAWFRKSWRSITGYWKQT